MCYHERTALTTSSGSSSGKAFITAINILFLCVLYLLAISCKYLLISVMIQSLATQAAYVPVGVCGMWVLMYLRSAEYGSNAALPL